MSRITLVLPDDLSTEIEPYRDRLDELLRLGLRELRKAESLVLLRAGAVSIGKAARLAGVPLREMIQYALAHGVRPPIDEEMIREELE